MHGTRGRRPRGARALGNAFLAAAALAALAALLAAAARADGPAVELPIGRLATPAGRITTLQAFPTGAAVAPNGKTLLAIAGPPIQGGSPNGTVALMVIDPATGSLRQTLQVDDAFQSIVFNRRGNRVYVAGGGAGAVHVLKVGSNGTYSQAYDLPVGAYVSGLALSRDGRTLWAAAPQDKYVAKLDPKGDRRTKRIRAAAPDHLALRGDGRVLYASNGRGDTVTEIQTGSGRTRSLRLGEHPTGLAIAGTRLLVANSNDATMTSFDTFTRRKTRVNLAQIGRRSDSPNAIAVARGGRTAYVSLGGDNAVAVLRLVKTRHRRFGRRVREVDGTWRLAGLFPTGWYPTAVALSPDGSPVHVVTARGLARSRGSTQPFSETDPASFAPDGAYATAGTLETLAAPAGAALAGHTAQVRSNLSPRTPRGLDSRNPLVAGRAGPIRHIVYVTRENKTYDAVLGDLHEGPGNELTVFGQVITPNLHALERQFVEAQNFAYQGFASVVGHMWEDAGGTSDRYERAIAADTGTHFKHNSQSWKDPENFPRGGTLADQAWKAGLSVRTYNMETVKDARLIPEELQADPAVFPNFDLHIPDSRREAGWESEFRQFEEHRCTGKLAATYGANCSLPDFTYVFLGGDHTTVVDEPGYPRIEAQVADNDYATGKLIDVVSHSSYWPSTLVIVVEDDPQGTGDHISAYRGLMAVASPWVKRGFITNASYNLASTVGAIDRILGLPPLTDYAATSRPLDDIFAPEPDYTPFDADGSGVASYPFVPLPGKRPKSDPKNGIYSFTEPDETNPEVSGRATWRQMKGRASAPRVSAP
ncbi:MAG TPA: bifunctional YncE family protein/alkaline phosphatase family protein [Thermoleophilaceae bacterium]